MLVKSARTVSRELYFIWLTEGVVKIPCFCAKLVFMFTIRL